MRVLFLCEIPPLLGAFSGAAVIIVLGLLVQIIG
jgi:hypothetical protein